MQDTYSERSFNIAPLERFVAPPGQDGSTGRYRMQKMGARATCDRDAVSMWVEESESDATYASRRALGEKLLNWSIVALGKPVSSLDRDELAIFLRFLANPQPAELWMCPRGTRRASNDWRPFTAPLDGRSRDICAAHLTTLLRSFARNDYAWMSAPATGIKASHDGFAAVSVAPVPTRVLSHDGTISIVEWRYVQRAMCSLEQQDGDIERRLSVELAYYAGLMLSEIASLTWADIETPSNGAPSGARVVVLRGFERTPQTVYALPPLTATLMLYARFRPASSECPLLTRNQTHLGRCINRVLREAACLASSEGQGAVAAALERRTAKALRHALYSHSGEDSNLIWNLLGKLPTLSTAFARKVGGLENERQAPADLQRLRHLWSTEATAQTR